MIEGQGPGACCEPRDAGLSFVVCQEDATMRSRRGLPSGDLQVDRDTATFNGSPLLIFDIELDRTAPGELEVQFRRNFLSADGENPDERQVAVCREQEIIFSPGQAADEKTAAGIFENRFPGLPWLSICFSNWKNRDGEIFKRVSRRVIFDLAFYPAVALENKVALLGR